MSDPNICTKCFGDATFRDWIRKSGKKGQCEIDPSHGRGSKVLPASKIAEKVDEFFRENYGLGGEEMHVTEDSDNPYYQQRGEPYDEIMMEQLECEEEVIRAIEPHLPDVSDREIMQGGEPFYDSSQLYENLREVEKREREEEEEYWYQNRFTVRWNEFCEAVIYKHRFVGVTNLLDDLFGESRQFEHGIIKPVYLLPKGQRIYRARLIDDGLSPDKLSMNPAAELTAPPKEKTRGGRMNVDFIPIFYAAFSEETTIAEVRPSLDDEIAIGEFVTRRDLKIFDFTVFSRSLGDDLVSAIKHTRYDFIDQLEREISKPVRAWDKTRQYIPTQIVAEYIRERFECDGIIYRSSMIRENSIDARNIALFDKRYPFLEDEGATLRFVKHEIKEVTDVQYVVDKSPF